MSKQKKARSPRTRQVPGSRRVRRIRVAGSARIAVPSPQGTLPPLPTPPEIPDVPSRPREHPWLWYLAVGATVVFLVGFSVFVFRLMTTNEQQRQQLVISNRAYRELSVRFIEVRNELTRNEELLHVLASPRIDVIHLGGFNGGLSMRGKIFLDPDKRSALLQVTGLPAVPEGKEYQLWLVRGDRQLSAGVFTVTTGGSSLFRVESFPEFHPAGVVTIAVTLEQKGGSIRPTGTAYLTGTAQM